MRFCICVCTHIYMHIYIYTLLYTCVYMHVYLCLLNFNISDKPKRRGSYTKPLLGAFHSPHAGTHVHPPILSMATCSTLFNIDGSTYGVCTHTHTHTRPQCGSMLFSNRVASTYIFDIFKGSWGCWYSLYIVDPERSVELRVSTCQAMPTLHTGAKSRLGVGLMPYGWLSKLWSPFGSP